MACPAVDRDGEGKDAAMDIEWDPPRCCGDPGGKQNAAPPVEQRSCLAKWDPPGAVQSSPSFYVRPTFLSFLFCLFPILLGLLLWPLSLSSL